MVPEEFRSSVRVGSRVIAPFKKSEKTGIVTGISKGIPATRATALPGRRQYTAAGRKEEIVFRPLKSLLDEDPLIPVNILGLVHWVANYYMSTSGLALKNAVPLSFFRERKAGKPRITYDDEIRKARKIRLTSEQENALEEINKVNSGVFLLHGVTGSGKTEIYINAIKSLKNKKQAIVLVPEIAVTAQMIDRFRSRFGNKVVFYHSGLSVGERITQWQKIRNGEARIVLGVRSAVFAPFTDLGLIVIDEEQEPSYKQFEGLRYNARDVALARAKLEDAKIILGTATPSLEVFYNVQNGNFKYLKLEHRIEHKPLPSVDIIDMTKEDKQNFYLSTKLLEALRENVMNGRQSLLMLNRRGYAPFYMCTDCGYTYKCPACSITLIYHKDTNSLNCHYCNSYLTPRNICPQCGGTGIKYVGIGTQRVEEELRKLIPELSLTRMDRDTTRRKLSHYRIIKQMEEKKINILLGTQMVAKGHDFPDVTLSAIISADVALNLPDFKSGERAFQLFTQLAGRAGRGDITGRTIIQTYEPDHYVFHYVRNHEYLSFYNNEIELRKELRYPPFNKLIRIVINFKNRDDGKKNMKRLEKRIRQFDSDNIRILGPAPAPIERIRNLWRWHLILKGSNAKKLRQTASELVHMIKFIKDIKVEIDVDPVNMM